MEGQISIFDILAGQISDDWQPRRGDVVWFWSTGKLNHGIYTDEDKLGEGFAVILDDLRQRWYIGRDRIYPSPAAAKEARRYV